jgi:hypothetical protein
MLKNGQIHFRHLAEAAEPKQMFGDDVLQS